jgi:ketosteroid isomerase-like protein
MSVQLTEAQQVNLALGERVVELYQSEGPWGVYEHFDEFFGPGFEWTPAISQLGDELYRGRDGFHQWITDMEAVASEFWQSQIELFAVGERHILVLGQMKLVGKESGASFESEYGSLYEIEDGLGVSGRAFLSHAEAKRAVKAEAGVRHER